MGNVIKTGLDELGSVIHAGLEKLGGGDKSDKGTDGSAEPQQGDGSVTGTPDDCGPIHCEDTPEPAQA